MVKIAPSILAADLLDIKNEVINVDDAGAEFIHIDVMDGHFVPNLSFGYNMVKTLRPITKKILDVHLMISPVEPFIKEFIDAGSDIISFHPEADKNTKEIISIIKSVSISILLLLGVFFLIFRLENIPRSFPILLFFISISSVIGPRVLYLSLIHI